MYSSKSGLFISRDFIEVERFNALNDLKRVYRGGGVTHEYFGDYIDGFNLYRASFIPNFNDPTGHNPLSDFIQQFASDYGFDLCQKTCGLKCKTCCGGIAAGIFTGLSIAYTASMRSAVGWFNFSFITATYWSAVRGVIDGELQCVENCKPCLSSCPKKDSANTGGGYA